MSNCEELESAYCSAEEFGGESSPLRSTFDDSDLCQYQGADICEVDVAIIGKDRATILFNLQCTFRLFATVGNGPSAIFLSLLLSGHRPHLLDRHPNPLLHAKLQAISGKCLLETVSKVVVKWCTV